jgi:hypothetical protein
LSIDNFVRVFVRRFIGFALGFSVDTTLALFEVLGVITFCLDASSGHHLRAVSVFLTLELTSALLFVLFLLSCFARVNLLLDNIRLLMNGVPPAVRLHHVLQTQPQVSEAWLYRLYHKIALFGVRTLLVTLYGTSAWLLTRAFRQ